jgi:hypothetical protein
MAVSAGANKKRILTVDEAHKDLNPCHFGEIPGLGNGGEEL